jgi:hypothetical protein
LEEIQESPEKIKHIIQEGRSQYIPELFHFENAWPAGSGLFRRKIRLNSLTLKSWTALQGFACESLPRDGCRRACVLGPALSFSPGRRALPAVKQAFREAGAKRTSNAVQTE